MDANYTPNKLRELSAQELSQKLSDFKSELFNLRFQNSVGHLKNTSRIKEVRKTIARILTIASEKSLIANTNGENNNAN